MYSDLRNKTIFDFTDDPKIIEEIVNFDPNDEVRKMNYLDILNCAPTNIAGDILQCAKITNNQDLAKACELLIKKLWREWHKRCAEAQKEGIIID